MPAAPNSKTIARGAALVTYRGRKRSLVIRGYRLRAVENTWSRPNQYDAELLIHAVKIGGALALPFAAGDSGPVYLQTSSAQVAFGIELSSVA